MFTQRNCLTLFYLLESEQNVRNTAGLYSQNIQPGEKTEKGYSLELIINAKDNDKRSKTGSRH